MKNSLIIAFLLASTIGMAQEQLNDYKYIVVPKKFEEFKQKNQYQTSTLVKYLFTEKGFDARYEDELPAELKSNGCLGLRAKLVDGSSLFTTKAALMLEDCNGQEVFTTKEGKSKEKDYKDSYGEALRDAFASFDAMDYSYNGKAGNSGTVIVNMENDVKKMDEEKREERTSVNRPDAMVEQEATRENQRYVDRRPVESDFNMAVPKEDNSEQNADAKNTEVEQNAEKSSVQTSQGKKYFNPGASKGEQGKSADLQDLASATLYAQEQPTGYQLVDSTPKIRIKIHKTSMPDFYLADAGGTSGVVFQKNGSWFFEYYAEGKLMTQELDVKF